jgi:hypothetical protein
MAAGFVGQVAALGVPRVSIARFPLADHQSHLTIVAVPGVPNCRPVPFSQQMAQPSEVLSRKRRPVRRSRRSFERRSEVGERRHRRERRERKTPGAKRRTLSYLQRPAGRYLMH